MSKKKFSGIEIDRVFIDELDSHMMDALAYGTGIHKMLVGLQAFPVVMPGSGRERGRRLGFVNCKHCKWKGSTTDMKVLPHQRDLPDHKRPRGYCPTCGGKCAWQRISVNQWRLLQP